MKLLLIKQIEERIAEAWLKRWLKGLSGQLGKHGFKGLARKELVVVMVAPVEMRRLNNLYRKKDYATDVLSFEPAEAVSVGELVICPSVLRAQAVRTGLSERGELGYMIVHGVLHLLGFDHEKKVEEKVMFALQDQIYSVLNSKIGLR